MSLTSTVSGRAPHVASTTPPCVGPWQLVYLLGEGTWASVYQARPWQCSSDEPGDYAVKVLKAEHGQDSVALQLLRSEATVAKAISNPHLTTVLSAHLSHPPYYLVMPRLEGGTVRSILDDDAAENTASPRSPLPVPHALWIVRQVTEALLALHSAGWVHGDVKPSNIFVSPQGHATLIDLGFARRAMSESMTAAADGDNYEILTGTPAYAAPEVFKDRPTVDPLSDIYSLGATLFEMVTGQRPFPSDNPAELAACHLNEPPPDPKRLAPHLHPRVVRLLQRLLAKNPSWRPAAPELLDTLVRLEIETLDERLSA